VSNIATFNVSVSPDGKISFIYSDELRKALAGLGPVVTKRAGNVEPGVDGWGVELVEEFGSQTAGPFVNRSDAIAAEVRMVESALHGLNHVPDCAQ